LGGSKGIRPVKKTEWWGAAMVICLERGADLHMAQLMPLPVWYPLTRVVLVKGPFSVCVHVRVRACASDM